MLYHICSVCWNSLHLGDADGAAGSHGGPVDIILMPRSTCCQRFFGWIYPQQDDRALSKKLDITVSPVNDRNANLQSENKLLQSSEALDGAMQRALKRRTARDAATKAIVWEMKRI